LFYAVKISGTVILQKMSLSITWKGGNFHYPYLLRKLQNTGAQTSRYRSVVAATSINYRPHVQRLGSALRSPTSRIWDWTPIIRCQTTHAQLPAPCNTVITHQPPLEYGHLNVTSEIS